MTELDEVICTQARTFGVLNQNAIVAVAFNRPVERDYGQMMERTLHKKRRQGGRGCSGDDKESFDGAAHHPAGFIELVMWAFIRSGENDGVGVLLGYGADGVRTCGEKWIEQVWHQDADLTGAAIAKRPGDFIGLIVKVVDDSENPLPHFIGHAGMRF